jgi:hypothetical protein
MMFDDDDLEQDRIEWYEARVSQLEAELVEAKAQRDSWKRIAESGLGITAETNCRHGLPESECRICDGHATYAALKIRAES